MFVSLLSVSVLSLKVVSVHACNFVLSVQVTRAQGVIALKNYDRVGSSKPSHVVEDKIRNIVSIYVNCLAQSHALLISLNN